MVISCLQFGVLLLGNKTLAVERSFGAEPPLSIYSSKLKLKRNMWLTIYVSRLTDIEDIWKPSDLVSLKQQRGVQV